MKKKSKIGTDAAKLHANITSNWKHLLFICWELVKPSIPALVFAAVPVPVGWTVCMIYLGWLLVPGCFPWFNNVWPSCAIVIFLFSKCKCTRTLSKVGRIREKAVWLYLTWMLQWILMKFKQYSIAYSMGQMSPAGINVLILQHN